jgi:hypothetical protein
VTVLDLLADCRLRGVELNLDGDRLRWLCRGELSPDLLNRLRDHKADLLAALRPRPCPACGRPTDARRRCWRCCDRPCADCGRPTGSAFVQRCCACGHRLNGNAGGWAEEE